MLFTFQFKYQQILGDCLFPIIRIISQQIFQYFATVNHILLHHEIFSINFISPSLCCIWNIKNVSPLFNDYVTFFNDLFLQIKAPKPTFIFGLALNYGPIWHMEWCPSGCYDEKLFYNDRIKRMGLLAVAGSVPTVNIYSIPFLNDSDDL